MKHYIQLLPSFEGPVMGTFGMTLGSRCFSFVLMSLHIMFHANVTPQEPNNLGSHLITSIPLAGIGWQAGRNGVMAPRDAGKLSFSFNAEGGGGNATLQRDTSQTVRFSDVRCLRLFTRAVTNARAANHTPYDAVWDRHSLRSTRLPFSLAYVTSEGAGLCIK